MQGLSMSLRSRAAYRGGLNARNRQPDSLSAVMSTHRLLCEARLKQAATAFYEVVPSVDVASSHKLNDLRKSEGQKVALKHKGHFGRCPHLWVVFGVKRPNCCRNNNGTTQLFNLTFALSVLTSENDAREMPDIFWYLKSPRMARFRQESRSHVFV